MQSSPRIYAALSGRGPIVAAAPAAGAVASIILAAAGAAAVILAASCAAQARPVVALDEAFVSMRPGLAALLQEGGSPYRFPLGILGGSPLDRPLVVPIALAESAGAALDAANAERRRSGRGSSLVASPLVAKALVEGGAWSGDPPLIVPEWRGAPVPGLRSVTTDPEPAYRAAGQAAGAFIAALSRIGGSPSCGVVFSEAPTRPRAALAAFAEAYAENSEGRPLHVRELGGAGAASEGAGTASPSSAGGKEESAVAELLSADIRVLFVALGPEAGAAIRAAARPGLAVGADFPYPEAPPSLAFRIIPNDPAMRRALDSELSAPNGPARGDAAQSIPALLVPEAQAASIRAGKASFKSFVDSAALRAKGPR
jgi:hypothetical protein